MRRGPLANKIEQRTAVTCVIGLGYVGLPETISFAQAGYRAIGININRERVNQVNAGSSYIPDVDQATLASLVGRGGYRRPVISMFFGKRTASVSACPRR